MSLKKVLPYILASVLLIVLISMVQSPRTLIKGRTSQSMNLINASTSHFYLPDGAAEVSAIQKADYEMLLKNFLFFSSTEVIQKTGRPLLIRFAWQNPYFAAFSSQKSDYTEIALSGGMARAPGATPGALAAILCHELGHILGGEPRQTIPGGEWASSEGQSDFYAASECLPRFLVKHPELVIVPEAVVKDLCGEHALCARTMQAGLEMIRLTQKYSFRDYLEVRLETPEENLPAELLRNVYPSDQCRLDTFTQGALCQLGGVCHAPLCWSPQQHIKTPGDQE